MGKIVNIVLLLIISAPSMVSGKEVQFRYLDYPDGSTIALTYKNETNSTKARGTIYGKIAKFTISSGIWDFELDLPFHETLRYYGKEVDKVDSIPLVISVFNHATIGGTLSKKLNKGIYIIDQDLIIPKDYQLLVEPGTIFKIKPEVSVIVNGQIMASGSENNPVKFTSYDTLSAWAGIEIESEYRSIFSNVVISGASQPAIHVNKSEIGLSNIKLETLKTEVEEGYFIVAENESVIEIENTYIDAAQEASLLSANASEVSLSHVILSNFRYSDGLISASNSDINLEYSTIYNNFGVDGSPIFRANSTDLHLCKITNSVFSENFSLQSPSCFQIDGLYATEIARNCLFSNNSENDTTIASNYIIDSYTVIPADSLNRDKWNNIWVNPGFMDPNISDFSIMEHSNLLPEISAVNRDTSIINYIGAEEFVVFSVEEILHDPSVVQNKTGSVFVNLSNVSETIIYNDSTYTLPYLQYNKGDVVFIGSTSLFAAAETPINTPDLDPGPVDITICQGDVLSLSQAEATDYTQLTWITEGDGSFDDVHILHPRYTPGPNDVKDGGTRLRITAINRTEDHYNESQWLILKIDRTFDAFESNRIESCSNEPIRIYSVNGETYKWSTGSTEQYIYAIPKEPTDYAVTVTKGACAITGTITLVRKEQYRDTISIVQQSDVVTVSVPEVTSNTAKYQWEFDNSFYQSKEKQPNVQFLQEGIHSVCITVNDPVEQCQSSFCKDFKYNLPKYEIGGQVFCNARPVETANAHFYRNVNGDWVKTDSTMTAENGYFHKKHLPLGQYKVKATLQENDPNFGHYTSTYFGETTSLIKADIVEHYNNSWKVDINLIFGTNVNQLSHSRSIVFPTVVDHGVFIETEYHISSCNIISSTGAKKTCTLIDQSYVSFANLPSGVYSLVLKYSDGKSEAFSVIK